MTITVAQAGRTFDRWDALHCLLTNSFAYMETRIDPPSSMTRMTPASLAEKAIDETLILALHGDTIVGCLFARREPDAIYIGKLAVDDANRGAGIARRLVGEAEAVARALGLNRLELQTRVELTENHQTFARLGFVETSRTAHEGFDRPTSITMQKQLAPISPPERMPASMPHDA